MNLLYIIFCLLFAFNVNAEDISPELEKYFHKKNAEKGFWQEKILPKLGIRDTGRSFALIAGVGTYDNLPELEAANEDIKKITKFLTEEENFDEIVILSNADVTFNNFRIFLEGYFREKLEKYPQSRFLFTYSGHGFVDGKQSYLLKSNAKHIRDKLGSINLSSLRPIVDDIADRAHHMLFLLNSCNSGSFLDQSFGGRHIPKKKGAHAITASGTAQLSWHLDQVGSGSVFFEKVLEGVRGEADKLPEDGIVTSRELSDYVTHEVAAVTNDTQNPDIGDLRPNNRQSAGSFFFIRSRNFNKKIANYDGTEIIIGGNPFGQSMQFTLSNSKIDQGEEISLTWVTKGYDTCWLDNKRVNSAGEIYTKPEMSKSFKLLCQANGETKKMEKKVVVRKTLKKIDILRFGFQPNKIFYGETTKLSWFTKNSNKCFLDGIGEIKISGVKEITPKRSKDYEIICINDSDTKKLTSRIVVLMKPTIAHFSANSNKIYKGDTVHIRWDTNYAESCTINGESVEPSGKVTIKPLTTELYQLICITNGYKVEKKLEIEVVNPPRVKIIAFSADQQTINSGASTKLNWNVEGADSCELHSHDDENSNESNLPLVGSKIISPSYESDYKLICENRDNSKEKSLTVNVRETSNGETSKANNRLNLRIPNRFPRGYIMRPCGCWGPNPMPTEVEIRCSSGMVRVNVCPGWCMPGQPRYAYVCF